MPTQPSTRRHRPVPLSRISIAPSPLFLSLLLPLLGGASACPGPEDLDTDLDGYSAAQGDCDDHDPERRPGGTEYCAGGVDDDCDGLIDEVDCMRGRFSLGGSAGAPGEATLFGERVAGGRDLSGDGRPDLLIGERFNDDLDDNGGALYVFSDGPFGGDVRASQASARIRGADRALGWAIAVGDVDGDGLGEIGSLSVTGELLLFDTPLPPEATDADAQATLSDADFDVTAYALAMDGDLDGDGLEDIVIGGQEQLLFGPLPSAVFIFTAPLPETGTLLANATALIRSRTPSDVGRALSISGDLNGDGLDDLALGGLDSQEGVFVFFGPVEGALWLEDADWRITPPPSATSPYFGGALAIVPDVNGDGRDDLLIGACQMEGPGGEAHSGAAYLVYGREGGLTAAEDAELILRPQTTQTVLGADVSAAGDVDGDGVVDLLLGFSHTTPDLREVAAAVVVPGGLRGVKDPMAVGAVLIPEAPRGDKGFSPDHAARVSAAGDIDGDGLGDVLFGGYLLHYGADSITAAFLHTEVASLLPARAGEIEEDPGVK